MKNIQNAFSFKTIYSILPWSTVLSPAAGSTVQCCWLCSPSSSESHTPSIAQRCGCAVWGVPLSLRHPPMQSESPTEPQTPTYAAWEPLWASDNHLCSLRSSSETQTHIYAVWGVPKSLRHPIYAVWESFRDSNTPSMQSEEPLRASDTSPRVELEFLTCHRKEFSSWVRAKQSNKCTVKEKGRPCTRRLSVGEEPPMLVIWGLWSCIVWRRWFITETEEEKKRCQPPSVSIERSIFVGATWNYGWFIEHREGVHMRKKCETKHSSN